MTFHYSRRYLLYYLKCGKDELLRFQQRFHLPRGTREEEEGEGGGGGGGGGVGEGGGGEWFISTTRKCRNFYSSFGSKCLQYKDHRHPGDPMKGHD